MKRKLRSASGFTLLESMAALAVLLVMFAALVAGTAVSVKVYRQSTSLSEAGVLSSTLFEAVSNELRYAADITTVGGGDNHLSTFTSINYGTETSLISDSGRIKISDSDLVGEMTYTDLNATADILYTGGVFQVAIAITDPSRGGAACSSAEFFITPLNP